MNDFAPEKYFDLSAFSYPELFVNASYVWDALSGLSELLRKLFDTHTVVGNYKNRKDVYIGEGTIVHESAEILGPTIIGKNNEIKHAAFLRENCLLGDNVIIGHGAEIKNTIILNNSSCAHLNYAGDSIIGNNVNIAGGAMLANVRMDKNNIMIKHNGKRTQTNLPKLGAIIGDNSGIGANSVLNPGTLLGRNNIVYPLVSVSGVHQENELIK